LKGLIEAESSPLALDPASSEIKVIDVRHAASAVHPHHGLEGMIGAVALRPDFDAVIAFLDSFDGSGEADVDPGPPRLVETRLHQVLVERRQRAIVFVKDRHLATDARGNMGEFEGDVPAAAAEDHGLG
jgi:hypothetical protein